MSQKARQLNSIMCDKQQSLNIKALMEMEYAIQKPAWIFLVGFLFTLSSLTSYSLSLLSLLAVVRFPLALFFSACLYFLSCISEKTEDKTVE